MGARLERMLPSLVGLPLVPNEDGEEHEVSHIGGHNSKALELTSLKGLNRYDNLIVDLDKNRGNFANPNEQYMPFRLRKGGWMGQFWYETKSHGKRTLKGTKVHVQIESARHKAVVERVEPDGSVVILIKPVKTWVGIVDDGKLGNYVTFERFSRRNQRYFYIVVKGDSPDDWEPYKLYRA